MGQKRFDEYFAKVVLEKCFPEKFIDLQIADKPDLRYGSEIGIEVTNCMPQEVVEAFNLWHRAAKKGEQTPPRILERLEQLKDTVHLEGSKLIWEQGSYVEDDIDNSPIKEFVNAVASKVERLNSANANYAEMKSYELFVNSTIDISTFNQIDAMLARLTELNYKPKKFDNIHLITINQKLFTFDREIDRIYTKSISRFARNYTETLTVVRELRDLGVPIIFEKENINTLDPKCGLILTVMASLAEQEIISMSKNQKWAARKRFANGSIELTRILGYSYEKGKLTVIPHEAAIVREIFDLYLQGNGVTKIAAILEAKGYRTVHNRTDWSRKSVLSVLKNEKYTGNCLLQKNICDMKTKKPNKGELPQYYIENSHEAIIPMEDFERVQKLMQVKVDKFHPNGVDSGGFRYPLSGKIKCGVCGATYKRKTAAKGQTYESIKWTCVVKDVKGKANCDSHEIKNDVVEKLLIEAYNESLDKKYAYSGAAEEYEKLKALLATEQELKTLHTKGYIADAQYRAECDRLLNEIKSREATIQTLQSRKLGEKRFEKSAVFTKDMADFLIQATVKDWTVTFEFANGITITRSYTNGRAGNVNGKLCKHKA